MLCYAAVMGNSANIVKATGMASTLALPELVHAGTSIVAERDQRGGELRRQRGAIGRHCLHRAAL